MYSWALLDVNNPVNCSTIVNLSSADYASCSINFENGTAYVTLFGSGKFEGLQVIDGTKESAVAEKNKNSCLWQSSKLCK